MISAGPVFDGMHWYVPESDGLVFWTISELIVVSDFSVCTRLILPCMAVTTERPGSDTSLFSYDDPSLCLSFSNVDNCKYFNRY